MLFIWHNCIIWQIIIFLYKNSSWYKANQLVNFFPVLNFIFTPKHFVTIKILSTPLPLFSHFVNEISLFFFGGGGGRGGDGCLFGVGAY